ncbi:MAG: hypothetical protein PHC69_07025 [Ruminiclostridium sp.]|nr:hypothetical protein [Ruminiclostridium sp.]
MSGVMVRITVARYGYLLSNDRKGYTHETQIIQIALKDISILEAAN